MRLPGQAARALGDSTHRVLRFVLAILLLLALGTTGLVWRLSQGPLSLAFLNGPIESLINKKADPVHVSLGGVSIAWDGFRLGMDQPFRVRLTDVTITSRSQPAGGMTETHIPATDISLSMRGLLSGRVLPRTVAVEGARIAVVREKDGTARLDPGGAGAPVTSKGGDTAPSPLKGFLVHSAGRRLPMVRRTPIP